jgi:hypothetical protein
MKRFAGMVLLVVLTVSCSSPVAPSSSSQPQGPDANSAAASPAAVQTRDDPGCALGLSAGAIELSDRLASWHFSVRDGFEEFVSLVAYVYVSPGARLFPQRFYSGTPASGAAQAFGSGEHHVTVPVPWHAYQVDAYCGSFTPGEDLTETTWPRYRDRTLTWAWKP